MAFVVCGDRNADERHCAHHVAQTSFVFVGCDVRETLRALMIWLAALYFVLWSLGVLVRLDRLINAIDILNKTARSFQS